MTDEDLRQLRARVAELEAERKREREVRSLLAWFGAGLVVGLLRELARQR